MTDKEMERRKAICEVAGVAEIDDLSDGFHTFRQLYYQRMMLFATIVKQNKDKAWKSLRHEDGEFCFGGGWFIVGVDTPEGSYTYHYEDNYYSLFDCKELERGKHWDGHTEKDVTRLLSLPSVQPEPKWIPCKDRLPERGNEVLVCYDFKGHRFVLTGVLYGDGSFHGYDDEYLTPEGRKYRKAVAWMPLPEPYQEEGDSE